MLDKSVSSSSEPTARTLTVHVAGAVNSPGLYRLNEGSRVADALGRAGGPAQGAVLDDINLAARLTDGEKVMVPRQAVPADGNAAEATAATGSTSSSRVNINTASEAQLDVLPGVGPALAARIVQYRDKNGPFSSVDELDNVSGIGPSKLDSLKDLVAI
ncbi:MAG TPA: ComEA family DNA-binding protein [Candidatus Anoxymicrobiaceae bacterium]